MGCIITPSTNFDKHAAHKNSDTTLPFLESMDRRNQSNHFPLLLSFSFFYLRVMRDFLTVPVFLHLSESVDSSLPLLYIFLFFRRV